MPSCRDKCLYKANEEGQKPDKVWCAKFGKYVTNLDDECEEFRRRD